jgi:hypothetical protein
LIHIEQHDEIQWTAVLSLQEEVVQVAQVVKQVHYQIQS